MYFLTKKMQSWIYDVKTYKYVLRISTLSCKLFKGLQNRVKASVLKYVLQNTAECIMQKKN